MKKLLLFVLLSWVAQASIAQTISSAKYPYTYTASGATLEDLSSGATEIFGTGHDDDASGVMDIGFDFWFVGVRYTQFSANSNGLLRLGGTAATSTASNSLAATSNNPKITAFWDDLSTLSSGGIRYKVIGTAPNRKLVIDYYNMGYWTAGTGTMNYQVWLFETTGVISFVYGTGMTTSTSYSVGIANSSTVYASINANTNVCNYGTGVVNNNTVAISSGRKYTFTPLIPAAPTAMTFSSVTGTAMTVNWTAASPTTNIYGYALYRSDDGGTTYTFVNTYSGASTTTAGAQTGLTAGVTYTWKVVAYTEGGLSSALVGSQATSASPCSGTPTAGTVSASVSSGCSAYSTTLSVSGATSGFTGLTYQWQTSSDNSSWSNVTGATNLTYATTVSSSLYYRRNIGCTPSSTSASTTGLQLGISNCYTMSFTNTLSDSICSGLFYDDGGATGNYGINGTSTYTFYPAAYGTGSKVSVSFNSFSSESGWDYLYIYNGNSTAATLLGSYTGSTLPSSFTSTAADGSLTFQFYSDISTNAAGFSANLSTTAVNPITANPAATTNTCTGYSPTLSVTASGINNSYAWYNNGTTNSNSGGTATGVTTNTFAPTTSSAGTTYYYCVVTTACGNSYTTPASAVIVSASPAAITGTFSACSGNTSLLADATGSGAWTTSSAIASVSSGGLVTAGASAGTTIVSYTVSGCAATAVFTVNASPGATSGSLSVCTGATTALSNTGGFGTWTSAAMGVATVGSATGIVTGVSAGTATISYQNGCGSAVTSVVTVNQTPGAITGSASSCMAATTALSNPNSGGTWSSSNTAVATIVAATGVVTGVTPGTATISYDLGNGCTVATRTQTVSLSPPSISISPSTSATICLGNNTAFTASTTPTVNLVNQNFNSGMADGVAGTWTVVNTGTVSPYNWSIVSSGSYAGASGDGSNYAGTNADGAGSAATLVTQLRSPSFSTAGYASASLTFNYYCNSNSLYDYNAEIDYSLDGGTTWTQLYDYYNTTSGSTTWSAGTPTQTIALPPAAMGQSNVMLRWYYNSNWGFYWVLDNVKVTASYTSPTYTWAGISGATGLSCTSCATSTITPTALGANVYSVTATANGCSSTNGVTLTTEQAGAVTVSGGGTACGSATLTASGGSGGTIYYEGTTSGGTSTATPSASQTVSSSGTYYFRARTATASCWGTQGSAVVTITSVPTAAPTNSGPICAGGTVTLNANPAGGATTYSWSGPSLSSTTVQNPTATPTVTSVYSLTVTNGTGNPGCSPATVYTTLVTVNSTPTAAPANDGYICNGGTVNLTANPAGGASTYSWSGSNLSSSTVANPTATPTVTSVYSLTVTNGTAASGCSPTTVYTTSVTVNNTPTAAPTNNGHICIGGTVTLTANGSGASTYAWSGPNLSSSTVANPTATPTVTSVYSVVVTDGTSRSGCTPTTVYTTSVTVNSVPTAAPSNNGPICNGGTVTLAANGANGAAAYSWSGSSLSATNVAGPTATPTVTSVYSVTVSDGSGHSGCSPSTVYTTSVSVNTTPTAAPTNSGYICNGGTVTLTANPAGGANTYAWSGPSLSSTTAQNPTATPTVTSTYSLTVTNGTSNPGCSPTTVYTTTVTVNSTPTAAPTNNGHICVGGTVTLTANPTGATVYSWSGASLASTTAQNPTATPTATSVYSLMVSDGSGHSGCSPSTVYTTSVTVNSVPTAAPTNDGPICNGGTVTLAANGANGAAAYSWSGSSLSATNVAGPTATPTVTSVYSVTVSDGSGHSGCSPSTVYTTSVTVNSTPTAAPTNNGYICVGGTVNLTANPANGASTYSWSGPSLSSSTVANPTATPTVTSVYSLTVTNGTSASGCSPSIVYTTSVTVHSKPTAGPTNNGYICNGGTVTLTANAAGGANTYTWSGSALASTTAANPTATPTATSVYSLMVSDGTSRSGCAPSDVYTTSVTVNAKPTAAPTNSSPICNGGTVTLTANPAGGANTYSWSGSSLSLASAANPTATPTVTSVYSLTVSDGSSQPGCAPSTVYTTSVTVNSTPTAAPTNNGYICNGGTVTLTANPGGGANTYAWSGPSLSSSTAANPTATPTSTSVYSLTVTNGTAGSGCAPSTIYTTSVTVNAKPTAAPTNSGLICNGGTVTLTANAAGGASAYTWNGSSLSSSTVANPTATPSATTVYSLTVSDGSTQPGCSPADVYTTSVSVNPAATLSSVTSNTGLCEGATLSLSANGASSVTGYAWSGPVALTGAATATPSVSSATTGASGIYTVVVNNGSGSGCTTTYTTSVTVNTIPTVASINPSTTYMCINGSVTFTAGATSGAGSVTSYNWSGPASYATTTATNSATYVPSSTSASGIYTLSVTYTGDGCTSLPVTSSAVTVNALPTMVSIGVSPMVMCAGGVLSLTGNGASFGGTGTLTSYNWSGPGSYSSSTSGSTQLYTTPDANASGQYSVTVTYSPEGCTSLPVASAAVTVNPLPVPFNITGGGFYCSGGSGVVVGLDSSETGINYQLYLGSSAVGSPVAGTGSPISFGLVTAAGTYSVSAVNTTTSCGNGMNGTTSVSIGSVPSIYTVTGGGGYCAGGSGVGIGLSGSDLTVGYQLYQGATAIGSIVPGTGSALSFGTYTTAGTYTVVANPGAACASNMSGSATVSINPLPDQYTVSGGGSYCAGGTGYHITQDFSVVGINYQLYNGATAVGSPIAGAASGLDFGVHTDAGTYTVLATNTTTGCIKPMLGNAVIIVNPLPAQYTVSGGGSYCSGTGGLGINLSGSESGINYQVYNGSTATGSAVSGTGSALSLGTFTAAGTYSVRATNATTACVKDMTGTATIVINALPTAYIVGGGGSYCSGGAGVHVGLSNSDIGINYQLYLGSSPVGSATPGAASGLDFGFMTAAGTYTVFATNSATGCVNNMTGSTTVSINPLPTVYTVSGGGTICAGTSGVAVGLSSSQSGINYQLYNGSTATGSTVAGTGAAISFGSQTAAGTYTVLATNATTLCTNNMTGSASVIVNAAPVAYTVTGGGAYCSGGSGNAVGLSSSQSGINYQLYRGSTAVGSAVAGTGSALTFGTFTTVGTYSVHATNSSTSCQADMSGTVAISINALPNVYAMTGGGSYCSGGSGVSVGLANTDPGINYQLYRGSTAVGSPVGGVGSAIDFGAQTTAGTYTVLATNATSACTSNMSGSSVVTVNSLPTVYTMTGGGSYCSGGTGVSVGLFSSQTGVNYQLYRSMATVGSVVAGTGSALNFGLQTVAGTYSVIATNATTSCTSSMTGTSVVTVLSVPSTYSVTGGGSYCSGGSGLAVGLAGSQSNINYQLYRGSTATGSPLAGTGSALSFGTFTTAGTYSVHATDAINGCSSNMMSSALIIINPLPSSYSITGGGHYCSGGSGVPVGMSYSAVGISYQLYRGSTAVGSPVAGAGSSISFGLQTVGGTYSVLATNATTGCMNGMSGTTDVVVDPLPVVYTVTGGGAYCAGGSGLSVGLSGSESGITYQLYNGSSAVSAPVSGSGSAITFGTFTAAGTYSVHAVNTSTTCSSNMSGTATIIVNPLPVVYSVTGGGTLCAGAPGYHIGLANSQSGISYQLYKGSTASGSPIAGTGAALDFGVFTVSGTYSVHATNTTTSCVNDMLGTAVIVVNPLPVVQTVTGGGSYCAGGAGVNIGLASSQSGIRYQLYRGATTVGSPLPGTGSAISFGSQLTAGTYTVLATDSATACTSSMSGSATVIVNPLPVANTVTGGGHYCSGGAGVSVGLSGSQSGIMYQLYQGSSAYGSVTFGTGSDITFGVLTAAGTYTVRASNSSTGCVNNMTGSATITIDPLPTQYAITGGGSYCSGGTGYALTLAGSQVGVNYRLYNGTTAVGAIVAGTGSAISLGTYTAAGTYTVLATNASTGCMQTMSGSATISILSLPVVHNVTGGGAYCSGGIGVNVGIDGTDMGISYQLYNGSTAVGSPFAGTGVTLDFGLQTAAGTYTVRATNSFTGCVRDMAGNASISVNALPVAQFVSGGGSYCSGGTGVNVGLESSQSGVSYRLYRGAATVGAAVAGTGSAISFGLQTTAGVYTVMATSTTTGCTRAMTGAATVSVNALPSAYSVSGGGSYCNGGTGVSISLAGSSTGVSYQLYNGASPVGAAVAGTGSSISFGLATAAGTYTVKATNSATGCTANMSGSATVLVNALPTAYSVTGGGNYCAGGFGMPIGLLGSGSGVNYTLYNGASVMGTATGTGGALSFGSFTASGTYTVRATVAATGCTAAMTGGAAIGINPLPVSQTVTGGGNYCAGGSGVGVGLTSSETGVNYQLYKDGVASGTAFAGTGTTLSFGSITAAGTYSVAATNASTGCGASMSGTAVVGINPVPTANTVTGGGNYCSGGSGAAVGLDNSQSGIRYQLYTGALASGTPVTGTGSAISFGTRTASGTYSVMATDMATGCSTAQTGTAVIGINSLPVPFTVSGGGTMCAGTTGFAVSLSGSSLGVTYQLYNGATATGSAMTGTGGSLSFGTFSNAGTYTVMATNGTTGCSRAMTGSAVINVNALPVAQTVTGGGAYCEDGTGVHVGLASSASGVVYQLYNGTATSGSSIPGTGGALDFGYRTAAGTYTVHATNALTGCQAGMPGSVTITVNAKPIAQTVIGGGNYCAGGAGVYVSVGGSQSGVSYQLYNGATATGTAIAGTGAAITFGPQTAAGTYTVLATNTATSCVNNMTGSASVIMNALPTVYNMTGGGAYCSGGNGVNVGLSGSTVGVSYQLYNGAATVGTAVAGTGSAMSFGLMTASGSYSVVATNSSTGCVSAMSGAAVVTMNATPIAYNVTGGGSYCAGGAGVHIGLSNSENGLSYQLYRGSAVSGSAVASAGGEIDFGIRSATGTYTVRATNTSTGCATGMIGDASVAVSPLPVVYSVTGGGNYCYGGSGMPVGLSGSTTGILYQLYNGSVLVGSSVTGSGASLSFGNQLAGGTYSVSATDGATGCASSMAGTAAIVVNALPTVYNVTGGGSFCSGSTGVSVGLDGSESGVSYKLYNGSTQVGSAVSGAGSDISFGTMSAAGTYSVMAVNNTSSCTSAMSGTVDVSINALPAVYAVTGGGNYCAGGAGSAVGLANSQPGITYQLYSGSTAVGTAVYGAGSAISFGMQTDGAYSVRATNSSTGCTSAMTGMATVTSVSLPVVYNVTGGGSYCQGGAGLTIDMDGSQSGVSYQLYRNGMAAGSAVAGTGLSLSFGTLTSAGTYSVMATNTTSGCSSSMSGMPSVTVNALPTAYAVSGGGNYCAGGAGVAVGLEGTDAGTQYTLYNGSAMVATLTGSGTAISYGNQTAGTYSVMAVDATTGCGSSMTGSVNVIMNAVPVTQTLTASGSAYCAGGAGIAMGLGGSETGVSYQLYNGGALVGTAIAGTGSALSFGNMTANGNYSVVATNTATGCTGNMSGVAPVVINPVPMVYPVSGGGAICSGATGLPVGLPSSAVGITYKLTSGSSVIATMSGTGAAITIATIGTPGTYNITATDAATGCTRLMSGNAIITNYPLPFAYNVTGGGNYCSGDAGVHVGLSGSSTGTTYQLYKDGVAQGLPVTGTGLALDYGVRTAAGVYTVRAVNSTTGCAANMTGSVTVGVNTLPDVYSVIGGGGYCPDAAGIAVGLSGSATGVTYKLYAGSTLVGTASGTGGILSFGIQSVTGTYSVSAVNTGTGCTRNMTGTAIVSVNPLPAVQTVTGGGAYCAGGSGVSIGLAATQSGVQYQLYRGSATTGVPVLGTGSALLFGTYPTAGTYSVRATVTATGCATDMSGTASVVVNPTVAANVTLATSTETTVCAGTSVMYTATPVNGGTTPAYNWMVNGAPAASTSASFAYTPANGDVITVQMASSELCPVPAVASASVAMTVNPNNTPSVSITSSVAGAVCTGASVTYSATPTYGGTTPVYEWLRNNAIAGSGVSYTVVPDSGDVIACRMTSNFGCVTSAVATSATDTVDVVSPLVPVVVISSDAGPDGIQEGEFVTFTATITNAGTAPEIQWLINNEEVAGATTPSFITNLLHNLDTLTIRVLSSGPCGGQYSYYTLVVDVNSVAVAHVDNTMDVRVVPNPTTGKLLVKGDAGSASSAHIRITSMLGQEVYSTDVRVKNGTIDEQISLSNELANGMYLLNVSCGNASRVFHVNLIR